MSAYFEVAYAAASQRLCFFTGTGFSKAVSNGAAPSWQELLEKCCDELDDGDELKGVLFPDGGKNPLTLEEAAQVIDIEFAKVNRGIHEEICRLVNETSLEGDNSIIEQFFEEHPVSIVTTNYDKLAEELIGEDKCHSLTPGLPVPRSSAHADVYHIHGSVDSPSNMVVTSENYYEFINTENYFSRKLSTVLHENTVVILGYSLGDTNLKAILSDYRVLSNRQVIGGNIFLISHSDVGQYIKDYYAHCYGIRVIDCTEIHDFFSKVSSSMIDAQQCTDAVMNLKNYIFKGDKYKSSYLKVSSSLYEILSAVGAIGKSVNDKKIVKLLSSIITKKTEFTKETGAWGQYSQLADWLVYLASKVDINVLEIKDTYLSAAYHSMTTMSKSQVFGYSWQAYKTWDKGWSSITSSNRAIIRDHITSKTTDADALRIVNM